MKIAISTDNNEVSMHFGRCPHFTIVDIEDGKIAKKDIIDNPGHHPGFLPQFFHDKGISCIIAGAMGQRASMMFEDKEIKVIVGVSGSIDEVINEILKGTLKGGESLCKPGSGKGYGVEKEECDHNE